MCVCVQNVGHCVFTSMCYWPLTCGDQVISVYLVQYHDCWCPGSLCRQDISNHDIGHVEYVGPGLTWGWILSTCVISMWCNDIKCKYTFMFPLQNWARNELTQNKETWPTWGAVLFISAPWTVRLPITHVILMHTAAHGTLDLVWLA